MASLEEALKIERLEADIFRGAVVPTQLPRTFGGQVAGQALISATRTVDPKYTVHSLHAYFLRPGNPTQATIYLVDRIREGRSFSTRRVTGVQDGKAIFTMEASYHVGDNGPVHQSQIPSVALPENLPDPETFLPEARKWLLREWPDFDIRLVPEDLVVKQPGWAAQQQVWFRYRHKLPDTQIYHDSTLAYMSDMTLLGAAKVIHPGVSTQNASLDHALWFLRPFRADEWLLYDQSSPSAEFGRGLTQGRIFDLEGRLVAFVVQEGLIRYFEPNVEV